MQKEDKCEIIADYENKKAIEEAERCTEYNEDFGIYVFKMNIENGLINERYAQAKESLEGKYAADGKKIVAVYKICVGHNYYDTESHPLEREDAMLDKFYSHKTTDKQIGIKHGEESYFLIRKQEAKAIELLALPMDVDRRLLERLDEIRGRWMHKLLEKERADYRKEIDEIISQGERTSQKQDKFDYLKEITKRMKINKKVFVEERMEGYDFREVDLSDSIFISCEISNSNFCGVNMENAIFVNCQMKDCMYAGAKLNHCRTYYGGEMIQLFDKTRHIIK